MNMHWLHGARWFHDTLVDADLVRLRALLRLHLPCGQLLNGCLRIRHAYGLCSPSLELPSLLFFLPCAQVFILSHRRIVWLSRRQAARINVTKCSNAEHLGADRPRPFRFSSAQLAASRLSV